MLSGLGVLPRVGRLKHLLYTSWVIWVLISVVYGPRLSSMISLRVCHGYLRIVHIHVFGWSTVSLHRGACLWNDVCWVWYILLVMSVSLVKILLSELCMQ